MPSTDSKQIICNAEVFYLQQRSVSVIMVQTPTELYTQHIYALDSIYAHDLPLGLIA